MSGLAKGKSFGSIKKFFRDTASELRKVIWPKRQQIINNTLAVIASIIAIGIVVWGFDLLIGFLVRIFLNYKL